MKAGQQIAAMVAQFGQKMAKCMSVDEAVKAFPIYRKELIDPLGKMLHELQVTAILTAPPVIIHSFEAYMRHYRKARTMESMTLEAGTREEKIKCMHAFIADMQILQTELLGARHESNTTRRR